MSRSSILAGLAVCMIIVSPNAMAREGGGAQLDREIADMRREIAALRAEVTELRRITSPSTVTFEQRLGTAQDRKTTVQAGISALTLTSRDSLLSSDKITIKADKIILDAKDIEIIGNVTSKTSSDSTIKGTKIGGN